MSEQGEPAVAEWVDEVADAFEAAWHAGPRPRIADFVGREAGQRRRALLGELVKLDLAYRRRAGERAALEDYRREFPELFGPDGTPPDDLLRYAGQLRAGPDAPDAPPPVDSSVALRCPQCGNSVAPSAAEARDVCCPSCGASFRVESGRGAEFRAGDLPRVLGKFQLVALLGRGSFGAVYKARDLELDRWVAVKVPRAGCFASAEEQERFLREARSAAQLNHPHIVAVHDVAHDGDLPYLVSDYVEGRTLAERLAERRPAFREAAGLAAQIADALDYAHRRGVVHRDVNPRNILLDAAGQAHVTDFGLAHREGGGILVTLDGQVLGTPAYMSPEQAAGQVRKVDRRSDVYSLGVVLYEMLTGEVPFRGTIHRLLDQVIHDEPRPPRQMNDRIPRDLQTICLKAMAKAPARRYATAGDLAADLRRYLRGEPIQARPVGRGEKLWRWCRRHPVEAILLGLTALLLVVLAGLGWQQAATARGRQRDQEQVALVRQVQLLRLGIPYEGWSGPAWDLVRRAAALRKDDPLRDQAAATLAGLDVRRVEPPLDSDGSAVAFDATGRRLLIGGARADDRFRRPAVGARCWDSTTGEMVHASAQTGPGPVAFRRDGTPVQLVMRDGPSLLVWDVAAGRKVAECRFGADAGDPRVEKPTLNEADVPVAAFSPDGSLAAAAATGPDDTGVIAAWDGASGRRLFQVRAAAGALAFSPDNTRLAAGTNDGRVTLWSVPQGMPVASWAITRWSIKGLAFDSGGRMLAVGDTGGEIHIADGETGQLLSLCHEHDKVYTVAFNPDGTILASAGRNVGRLWDVATGRPLLMAGFHDYSTGLAFSPDGRRVAASSVSAIGRGQVSVWELEEGRGIRTFRGLSGLVQIGQFSPDGRRLAALSNNWQVAVWDVPTGRLRWRFDVPPGLYIDNAGLAFRGDGREIAFAGGKAARCWDLQTGKETGTWDLPYEGLQDALAFPSPDVLLSFRVETRQGVPPFSGNPFEKYPRVCRIRNLRGRAWQTAVAEITGFNRGVFKARACPDESCFAVFGPQDDAGGSRRVVKVFDARTGGERFSRPLEGGSIRFDPTGRLLALGTGYSPCLLVDPASGRAAGSLPGSLQCIGPGASHWIDLWKDPRDRPKGFALVRRGDGAVLVAFDADPSGDQMVTFNPAGDLLAWGTPEGVVHVADIERVRQRLNEVGLGW
jgi:WD40 repeat protein